ncbi:hypothetical protein [Acinetobacter thermotolerans]|uniref:hypothetical protein n=1 Tax=Acinetobacter thermotolerans TaxID=3151487 RepID=UPI00325B6650
MPIISVQKLENADKDATSLDTFISGTDSTTVTTRKGRTYPSLANAVRQVMETGGFEPFATELDLLASIPTIEKKAAKALDTKKIWYWDGSKWNDTGLSEKDSAIQKVNADFLPKYLSSSDEILLAITDDLGNLTWLQVDKQTGLPTKAVIEVLREINQIAVEDEITTLNGEKIAVSVKDKNGNLTALTVRESDGMFTDDVVEDIGERLGVMSDSAEFRSYNTPTNINILKSISAGIIRHIEQTPLPATPYNFTDSSGQNARIYLPTSYNDSTPIPLVIVFDGIGGSSTPTVRDSYLPLLEQGVALCKSQGHGDSYGNPACMQSYLELFKKACEIAPIGAVILVGNSMGAIAAQNALLTQSIPSVSGLYLTDPTYSLRQRYDNGRKADISAAYNIASNGSDYAEKTKGYDPALRHWSQYMGLPIHIRASSGDTAVRLSEHGQKLKDYLSIHNDVTLIDTGTAGHNTADRFDATDLFSFIQKCTKI